MRRHLYFLQTQSLLALASTLSLFAQHSSLPDSNFPAADAPVRCAAETNGIIYIGGDFHYLGKPAGGGAIVSTNSVTLTNSPRIEGTVLTAIPDGSGGWFIGGSFSQVNQLPRTNLAHIFSNGGVDSTWVTGANGEVRALLLTNNTLYVGGAFTEIGGQTRNRLAATDPQTGVVSGWNPNMNGAVNALTFSSGKIYAGGEFTKANSISHSHIAAIDASTGAPTSWNPSVIGIVNALALNGDFIFLGGTFTSPRTYIAQFSLTNDTVTAWNALASDTVRSIVVSESLLYVGGDFLRIGSQNRNCLAALNITNATATSWNPNADGPVQSMQLDNGSLLVSGKFGRISNQNRFGAALIDPNGSVLNWTANLGGQVFCTAIAGTNIFLGGNVLNSGAGRFRLAAVEIATGTITSWNPDANQVVNAITIHSNSVYVGGGFSFVGGQARTKIAELDLVTGAATSWTPEANAEVYALLVSDNLIYVGGSFSTIGGQTRNSLAAIDRTTGLATSWNPNLNSTVYTMVSRSNALYIGGFFTSVGAAQRNRVAAFDLNTGALNSWNPNANNRVYALAVTTNAVYMGGIFTSVSGQPFKSLVATDPITGSVSPWNVSADNTGVYFLAAGDQMLYAAGESGLSFAGTRRPFSAFSITNGSAFSWNPGADGGPADAILNVNKTAIVVGEFTAIAGQNRSYLAAFPPLPRPQLSLSRNGGLSELQVGGDVAQRYVLEISTNLLQWNAVYTNSGNFNFSDSNNGFSKKFYRAVQLP